MTRLDRTFERLARQAAQRLSRRSLLGRLGALAMASAAPILPVSRATASPSPRGESDDPQSCDYWRYCAIDGYLCSCCGGSTSSCPPGTEPSQITWVGTCRNPHDGMNYVISYNDCCGKSDCGRCDCYRNEGDHPIYQPSQSNDINWCVGAEVGLVYNCSTSRILGVAG